ncbi:DUF3083 family protein [Thalassotalea fonticola]|uniref:DUF3083 family protein n=1 Tax=Thalassotalea fonticola TaxID=3065649 RepID=A0ABZ0GP26_9GAMM|nr:DUF3083 family protein [Colwelliaceae bacterium S1-1]
MLKVNSRINLIRKRSAADKVYVPSDARENQYVLVEFKPNLALLELISGKSNNGVYFSDFYRNLSHSFFNLCEQYGFENVSFIAKNKLVRVMYAQEQQVIETQQQILFMYNPEVHTGLRTFFNADLLADKIELLFLATGEQLRLNAPEFHQRVSELITTFSRLMSVDIGTFKIRDHQHLTYDVFSSVKGNKKTVTHGFRPLIKRYQQQSLILPKTNHNMTFAIASLPVNKSLLQFCDIDESAPDPYNPLYTYVSDLFVKIAKQYNLNQLAIVANGKVPIIRQDNEDYLLPKGELLYLGFKPVGSGGLFVSQWDSQNLVDTIKLVFIASEININKRGYGRFVNHLTEALKQLSFELGYKPNKDTVMLRFHQHLMYNLPKANDSSTGI